MRTYRITVDWPMYSSCDEDHEMDTCLTAFSEFMDGIVARLGDNAYLDDERLFPDLPEVYVDVEDEQEAQRLMTLVGGSGLEEMD